MHNLLEEVTPCGLTCPIRAASDMKEELGSESAISLTLSSQCWEAMFNSGRDQLVGILDTGVGEICDSGL